jgi:ATP-binding cassette, subfamily F, member 3
MSYNSPVILSFDKASFAYNDGKRVILNEANFSIRENTKITIMGQNGAGKSTMFKLIMGELKLQSGKMNLVPGKTVAISRQVIPRDQMWLTVKEYFATAFKNTDAKLEKKIVAVLDEVNLVAPLTKTLKEFSGGQQARLLLAHALIQEPDILLLDEPTNNLDTAGISHLISFILGYEKTVVVISHDADFLNMFTDGVLYLNIIRQNVEQYWGNYYDVVEQIAAQIEKERQQNARMEKEIQDSKDKINFFSNKGGKMRKLASKMRDDVAEAEENKVAVRKDDKTIPAFTIEFPNLIGPIVQINTLNLMSPLTHDVVHVPFSLTVKKNQRYILKWPNGIGKSTLLKRLTSGEDADAVITPEVRIGYYSQDFDALDMNQTVWDSLHAATTECTDQDVYKAAASFLLIGDLLKNPVYALSEGQKGLLCYARFVLQKPHLLILDEPTNHINFRHLPVIAEALNDYEGGIIMVSHDDTFVEKIKDLEEIDLKRLIGM